MLYCFPVDQGTQRAVQVAEQHEGTQKKGLLLLLVVVAAAAGIGCVWETVFLYDQTVLKKVLAGFRT